jgi:hypothetical protein
MAQRSNRNSAHADIVKNAVNDPESNNSPGVTARNELGEGAPVSKSLNQLAETDAITNVEEQQTLDDSDTQHVEMHIFGEELLGLTNWLKYRAGSVDSAK